MHFGGRNSSNFHVFYCILKIPKWESLNLGEEKMALTKVKLSICMPVYNGSKYIAKSIESVLSQTYTNYYLNVIDNCSTDNTEEIVRSFKDPRLRYIKNDTNLGLVGNHQRCIDLCETEFLNIWHDDDIMMPSNLEKKMAILKKNDNVGIVFSNLDFIDENDDLHQYKWNEDCQKDFMVNGKVLFKDYLLKMHIGAFFFIGSVISRKDVLCRAGGFHLQDSGLICDSSLWLRTLLITDAACIGDPLVKYRNYQGTTCSEFVGINFLKEHFNVVNKILVEHEDEIPGASSLRKEIEANFVFQAARRGIKACGRNDFQSAASYMSWIKTFSQKYVWNSDLWGLKIRLMLGPKAAKIYRPLKFVQTNKIKNK